MLSNKYFWRKWFVMSYDEDYYGDEWHELWPTKNSYLWYRRWKRCGYISSTNNTMDFTLEAKRCIEKIELKSVGFFSKFIPGSDIPSSTEMAKILDKCLLFYNGLAVVKLPSSVSVTQSGNSADVQKKNIKGEHSYLLQLHLMISIKL